MTPQIIPRMMITLQKRKSNMKFNRTVVAIALFCTTLFGAGVSRADGWPASLAGDWNVIGNQSPGTLRIIQFAGAAGSQCKPIRGFIYTTDAIEGFYCPGSGRITFVRYAGGTTSPKQFWSGNVSQTGATLRMGGTFVAIVHNNVSGTAGGSLGEYNYQASK
jgi:hypothetical protein